MKESNYDFRKRHWEVHKPCRRKEGRLPTAQETLIDNLWKIGGNGGSVTERAIADFQDYLWTSMGVSVQRTNTQGEKTIWISMDAHLDKGFRIDTSANAIRIALAKDEDAFRAIVYMEDCMNLDGAPLMQQGCTVRKPLYRWRSVHSGCGLDAYPDEELLATVHAGYDAIVLFIKGFDRSAVGYCDINDTVQRAKKYGIKTFLYNYIATFIHPDESTAAQVFDSVYGELFRRYPDVAGIHMAGESLEFPSKDPNTTGKVYSESVTDGIPDTRPSPGWYPCEDYPRYLAGIEKAVHRVKPDAEVIFSTYNWCYQPLELRRRFLENLPAGIRIVVPFDISAKRELEGLRTPVMDYTISQDSPSAYFCSECAAACELGIRIEGNTNTAGVAWDFGCVPYVPSPRKLINRLRHVRAAHDQWGLDAQYTTHHYGWWDCIASDLGKWASWEDFEPDYDELLRKIACRDYGDAWRTVLEAWDAWDQAMDDYVASNEDQYGPWRVGPAYPFIFQPNITRTMLGKEIRFPTAPHAHFGYKIIKTLYQPYENYQQAPGFLRYPADIRVLTRMLQRWDRGLAKVNTLDDSEAAALLKALGLFIRCEIQTVIHIKRWWLANMKLQTSASAADALRVMDELETIADEEEKNVQAAKAAVITDSRIGWEPSMEYVCDEWHLDWKLRQMESMRREMCTYRGILNDVIEDQKG